MLIIGHRGAAGLAPENTLSSFKKAEELGVDMIETDLRLRKDNTVIINHDSDPKREYINCPTLDEILANIKISVNLELKESGFEEKVLERIKSFSSRVLISSFDKTILEKIRALDENIWLGIIIDRPQNLEVINKLNLYSVHPISSMVNNNFLELLRKFPVKIFPWTVNELSEFERLKNLGVDGVFTDRPNLIKN